mmetsp:Transcript_27658/g.84846  ORF Transcript_27658/g.84846 Transcript_27658/m.84846 type:complete len:215 (-) Transcript_27658:112-756(-)
MSTCRSQRRWILSEGWWIVHSTVLRCSLARPARIEHTSSAIFESKPDVGSSHRMTSGFDNSSSATLTRLRWPPERPRLPVGEPTRVSAQDARPSCFRTASTRSSGTPRTAALYRRVSRGVSPAIKTSSCGIRHAISAKASGGATEPPRSAPTLPETAPRFQLKPPISSSRLVFPLPDGPMIDVAEPAGNAVVMSSRMTFVDRGSHGFWRGNVTT